eukprot:9470258-Pyramimonas_sp.AAC.2
MRNAGRALACQARPLGGSVFAGAPAAPLREAGWRRGRPAALHFGRRAPPGGPPATARARRKERLRTARWPPLMAARAVPECSAKAVSNVQHTTCSANSNRAARHRCQAGGCAR